MSQPELILWSGLAIGLAFGICGQITGFCLHRGLKEYWSGSHGYKLHAFALALAVALIGTHLASSRGLVDISQSLYMAPSFSWVMVPLGGIMFGYGMVLANGCGARALVLLGQGNLRSLMVLGCLGVAGYMTLRGIAAPLRMLLLKYTTLAPGAIAVPAGWPRLLTVGVVVALLLAFALRTRETGQRARDLLGGAIIGLLIVAGWVVTGWLGADDFEPEPIASLTFVAPIGDTLQYAMIATGMTLKFGIVIVLGVIAGSTLAAMFGKNFHLEGFESARQMTRYILGGLLMGSGGVLAMGCSIGQGLTGLSTLAYSSILAASSIIVGARLAWMRAHENPSRPIVPSYSDR